MMFAYRRFDKKTYENFKKFVDGHHLIQHDDLQSNYDFFENKLSFLGITAVEDSLQPEVHETLSIISKA